MTKDPRQKAIRRFEDVHKMALEALKPPPRRPPDTSSWLQNAIKTPQDDPKTSPNCPKTLPRWPQEDPKTLPRRPQDDSRRPKTAKDPLKTLSSHPKPSPDKDFGTILGSFS